MPIASLLISHGANINAIDVEGHTPLHWVMSTHGETNLESRTASGSVSDMVTQTCLLRMLLSLGKEVDVNAGSRMGKAALHLAVQAGNKQVVSILMKEAGADMLAQDHEDMTALHYAARKGDARCVEMLMKACENSRWRNGN
jgi:ankyrin repeat protein